ncbi:hypothetical protein ABZX30_19915 [Streptomyces sp. NPDC004542]|uniref:hypothetical protein n=1 Tax=Streptomyces sp. NPDC004542 TaxID=3154281 RepID=UPI0033BF4667
MASVEVSLKEMMTAVDGALGAAVVDYTIGMALGTLGGDKDLDRPVPPSRAVQKSGLADRSRRAGHGSQRLACAVSLPPR